MLRQELIQFHEASNEELHHDYDGVFHADYSEHSEFKKLQRAFEIDCACTFCLSSGLCRLPNGCNAKVARPESVLLTNEKEQVCLGTKYEGCVKCKHPERDLDEEERLAAAERRAEQRKTEYERKANRSGLAPAQQSKTLETYDQQSAGAECIVATKAMATLASKEKRNLVLAGMKSSEQAIVKNATELMDKLISVNR